MRKIHEIPVVLFSCGLQVLAVFLLRVSPELEGLPSEWFPQFIFLTGLSILLTFGFFLFHHDRQKSTLIFLNTIIMILKSYPTGQLLSMDIVLLTALFLPVLLFLERPRGIIISIVILSTFMAFQGENQVWETEKNALSPMNISFQEYAAGISEQSKMLERKRIAHDIHDSIGYNMMNIKMVRAAELIRN